MPRTGDGFHPGLFKNITFSEYQQLLSSLTAADIQLTKAMLNEMEMYHVHYVA